jgi:hypothetical protein
MDWRRLDKKWLFALEVVHGSMPYLQAGLIIKAYIYIEVT